MSDTAMSTGAGTASGGGMPEPWSEVLRAHIDVHEKSASIAEKRVFDLELELTDWRERLRAHGTAARSLREVGEQMDMDQKMRNPEDGPAEGPGPDFKRKARW